MHTCPGLHRDAVPLVYGIINTANYDVTGYLFIGMYDSQGLENVGCFQEDIDIMDRLPVGGTHSVENWPVENAIIIIKVKDEREGPDEQ